MKNIGAKIYKLICKSVYGLWLVIFILGGPLVLNLYSHATFLAGKTGVMGFAIYAALIIAFVFGLFFLGKASNIMFPKFFFWVVIAIGVALRLFAIDAIDVPLVSDFAVYYDQAKALATGTVLFNDYVAMFPHTIGYPVILSVVFKVFGTSIFCAQMFNIFCFVITAIALYYTVKNLVSHKVALISIIIFSVWPSQIIFTTLVSTEAVYTMITMIAVLLVSIAFKMKRTGASKKILLICFGTAGIIAATANQIRPTGIILVIAAISMIILLKWIDNEKFSLKTLIMRAIAIALMLTTFFATGILLRAGVSKIIGKDVAANAGGYTLFVGANIESFGSWNEDDAVGVGEMRTGGNYDPTELNDKLTQMGIERLLANPMATIKNMVIKNGIMWATDSYAMIWVEKSNQITFESGEYSIIMFLSDIEEAFYFAAMLFALFGVIRKLKQKSYSGDRSLFIYIIILGYGAAFILAEESNRYHYPALPFLAIAAAIGLTQIQKRNRLQ